MTGILIVVGLAVLWLGLAGVCVLVELRLTRAEDARHGVHACGEPVDARRAADLERA